MQDKLMKNMTISKVSYEVSIMIMLEKYWPLNLLRPNGAYMHQ